MLIYSIKWRRQSTIGWEKACRGYVFQFIVPAAWVLCPNQKGYDTFILLFNILAVEASPFILTDDNFIVPPPPSPPPLLYIVGWDDEKFSYDTEDERGDLDIANYKSSIL